MPCLYSNGQGNIIILINENTVIYFFTKTEKIFLYIKAQSRSHSTKEDTGRGYHLQNFHQRLTSKSLSKFLLLISKLIELLKNYLPERFIYAIFTKFGISLLICLDSVFLWNSIFFWWWLECYIQIRQNWVGPASCLLVLALR